MHATSGTDDKARVGAAFPTLELVATSGQLVTVTGALIDAIQAHRPSEDVG